MIEENSLGPVIVNAFGDQYLHSVNGSAFNKVGSRALYKKHYGDALFKENSLYIILGTDSGLFPRYIDAVGIPDGTRYIFVEIPWILDKVRDFFQEDSLDRRIILSTPDEWLKRAVDIDYQNYVYLEQLQFCRSIGAEDFHICEYQEQGRLLQEELEKIRWLLKAQLGDALFNLRQLENLAENRVSAKCLEGVFSGHSAVILGGGPSLDKALSWLKDHRNEFIVIAVSRICRRLLEVGLVPDIVVSIDPKQLSFDISKEMLLLWEKTLFVHQHHVSHKLLGQWRGRSCYLGVRFGWPTPWNDEVLTARGPTVTNCAIDLAVQMGCESVFLSGVDLCFSKDGFTHAQGSNEQKAGPQLSMGQLWVETNGGTLAETTPDLHFSILSISEQAREAAEKGCRIYSLSEESAQIDKVEFKPFADVNLQSLSLPAYEHLQQVLPEENSQARIEYLQGVLAELERVTAIFREIKTYAEDGLKANNNFFGSKGKSPGSPKYKNKMDRIEKKLKNNYSDFNRLIKQVGIKGFLKMTQGDREYHQWEDSDVERLGRVYYESYRDSSNLLLEMVEMARARVLCRLEEEKNQPDFKLLISQWEKDGQPGRALVWRLRHSQYELSHEVKEEFSRLENDFNKILLETETLHQSKVNKLSELGAVCGKLKLMYRRAESENLRHLLSALELVEGQEAKVLYHLGSGYLAELENDIDSALGHYQFVIDEMIEECEGSALEEALLRVFSLSLKRQEIENAILAANCLTGFSPFYLPYYAEMLQMIGEKVSALDVYASYLEQIKNDLSVMLKMGSLYLDLGVEDGARLMFSSVLEKDPENQAAQTLLEKLQ